MRQPVAPELGQLELRVMVGIHAGKPRQDFMQWVLFKQYPRNVHELVSKPVTQA